jgi:AraC-like DNA-binding protein
VIDVERVLAQLEVEIDPFAHCMVSRGWRLRLPPPPTALLHFVLQGSGTVREADGSPRTISPSTLIVVPPGSVHSLESAGEVQEEHEIPAGAPPGEESLALVAGSSETAELVVACGLVNVRFASAIGLFDRIGQVLVVDLSSYPQVGQAMQGILDEQMNPGPGTQFIRSTLMSQCLCYLLRHLALEDPEEVPWLAALNDSQLGPAVATILERPEDRHTVESLAVDAAMSRSAFARRFHDAFGKPPMHLLHDIRMIRAAKLLEASAPASLELVAKRVGFESRSHFSRAFKKYFGHSPVDHRSQVAVSAR